MGNFSVSVVYSKGNPAKDIEVMIYYDNLGGYDEKRTDSNGWVEFNNQNNDSGTIWVRHKNMGSHSLADGESYLFMI